MYRIGKSSDYGCRGKAMPCPVCFRRCQSEEGKAMPCPYTFFLHPKSEHIPADVPYPFAGTRGIIAALLPRRSLLSDGSVARRSGEQAQDYVPYLVVDVLNFGGFFGGETVTLDAAPL